MLDALGSVSERPKETVCKTVAEATMVQTHPGPLSVKALVRSRVLRPGPFFLSGLGRRNESVARNRQALEGRGGAAWRGGQDDPIRGAARQVTDDVEVLTGAAVEGPHDRAVEAGVPGQREGLEQPRPVERRKEDDRPVEGGGRQRSGVE